MTTEDSEEFGEPIERAFRGVSRGPGATLERAIQAAAQAAAQAGYAGQPFNLALVQVEPEAHNQWVRAYTVTLTA